MTTDMFTKQHLILQNLPTLRDLTEKYQLPLVALDTIEKDAHPFVVRVPLIGAFSAGKSSLLNALLDKPVFATAITAETAVPAELIHAGEDSFIGYRPNNPPIPLSADAVRNNHLSALQPNGWVEASLNAPILAELPHLRLVDMPGWDSGVAGHAQAIDHYAPRSLAYGVVVSAEEGNLRESIRNALVELALMDMPIIAIVSKCDKKPPEDVAAIAEQIRQEITQATGKPPLRIVKASARRKDTAEFTEALKALEQQAETLFNQSVAPRFGLELKRLAKHLETLSNRDDLSSEQIAAQIAQLRQDMQAFEAKLSAETQALDAQVGSVLTNISRRVDNSLKANLDGLANKVLHGGDLSGDILTSARLAVAEGIREEFAPAMQRYFDRLAEAVPPSLALETHPAGGDDPTLDTEQTKTALATIVTTLMAVATRHPLIAIAIPILHVLGELFIDHNAKQQRLEQQKENVRQDILNRIIPHAVLRIEGELRKALHQQVQDAKNAIAEGVRDQREAREASLQQLQAQLAQGQTEFAAARERYLTDLAVVQNLLTEVIA